MQDVNWVALIVFVALFFFITWLGFAAARWRRGDLDLLHEWGLGGRRAFYTLILNLVVAIVLTPVFNAMTRKPSDETATADYFA
jgi:hypothetical protein